MASSFFFYDLETSGFDPRQARIMQFAGQRTDKDLKPVGEPVNVLIKMTPDVLPDPDAIMVTGITPQQTIADGLSEAEFLKFFYKEVVQPDTIFVGFNNVRFDDEFMAYLNYRNFYDAYEWRWRDACSRWDILDVTRMTRALRPDGINWPFSPEGKPTNRLEMLTKLNKLSHEAAHDALSDVQATIDVARLIKSKQPDLFNYLLDLRDKKKIAALVTAGQPFVYTSGHYPSDSLHTSAAVLLTPHPQEGSGLVYDLRHDPTPFLQMSVEEIVKAWRFTRDPDAVRLLVKTMKYNRCPTVAPRGVMKDDKAQAQIKLSVETVDNHFQILKAGQKQFAGKVLQAVEQLNAERQQSQAEMVDNQLTVDARLYEGFFSDVDKNTMRAIRVAKPEVITDFASSLIDDRLKSLLPLYKARNYPKSLTSEELGAWEEFCRLRLFEGGQSSRLAKYFARLSELAKDGVDDKKQGRYVQLFSPRTHSRDQHSNHFA